VNTLRIVRYVVPMTALSALLRSLCANVRTQAWDTAVGQALDSVLTGSTFSGTVSNSTLVQNRDLSTAGIVEGYGFSINGCVVSRDLGTYCRVQHWQTVCRRCSAVSYCDSRSPSCMLYLDVQCTGYMDLGQCLLKMSKWDSACLRLRHGYTPGCKRHSNSDVHLEIIQARLVVNCGSSEPPRIAPTRAMMRKARLTHAGRRHALTLAVLTSS